MTANDVGRILWRTKAVMIAVLVVVIGAGALFLSRQSTEYQSESSIALLPASKDASSLSFYPSVVTNLIPTYIQLISSPQFLSRVAAGLPFLTTEGQLAHQVSASPVPNADLIHIAAQDSQPVRAQTIASQVTTQFMSELGNNGLVTFKEFGAPRVPSGPISPRRTLVLSVTFVLAVLLALAAGLVWDRLFSRIHDVKDLTETVSAPILGVLPDDRRLRSGVRPIVSEPGEWPFNEAMRSLRTNLIFSMSEADAAVVAVTSVNRGDGKSALVANLAVVTAELGFRVVIVDADIHQPLQHRIFGLRNDRGFTSVCLGGADPASLVQTTAFPGVRLVAAGPPLHNRAQEVSLYVEHLRQFAGLGDLLIVDTPPLRASADIPLLAAAAGAVVLAVRSGATSGRQIDAAVDTLESSQSHPLGLVLTGCPQRAALGDPIGYYRGYRGARRVPPSAPVR